MINIKKNLLKIGIFSLLILLISAASFSYSFNNLQEIIFPDQQPYIDENNRTLIPVRFASENLGCTVDWNHETREVLITKNDEIIKLVTGSDKAVITKNGVDLIKDIGTSSVLIEGRVMVPLRFLSETIGSEVIWDEENQGVIINRRMLISLNSREKENNSIANTFTVTDDFNFFNNTLWKKTNHFIENTKINSGNVSVENGLLKIKLPKNILEGGEIQSRKVLGFGSYEVRMKLPDVPSSITGFFLYKSPALYNEIDIEIYNEKNRGYFLTIYSDGKKQNLFEDKLSFDPTKDFHNYRIDYSRDSLKFYIDNNLVKEWTEGFTNENMYLLLNTWYPDWLDKQPPDKDSFLEVEWIRY